MGQQHVIFGLPLNELFRGRSGSGDARRTRREKRSNSPSLRLKNSFRIFLQQVTGLLVLAALGVKLAEVILQGSVAFFHRLSWITRSFAFSFRGGEGNIRTRQTVKWVRGGAPLPAQPPTCTGRDRHSDFRRGQTAQLISIGPGTGN